MTPNNTITAELAIGATTKGNSAIASEKTRTQYIVVNHFIGTKTLPELIERLATNAAKGIADEK